MKIAINLFHQYMTIFFNFPSTPNHLHPLQVENCDSNSRLVVDKDDHGKFRLERGNIINFLSSLELNMEILLNLQCLLNIFPLN